MPDPSKQPKPWRCKHCDERVDPTMSLCWNCGYDREGTADPASFIERYENESPICTGCGYDLKGNPDADACPECGTPAPWVECTTCGVRSSRAVMANGCPACRAREAGVAFIPEVERKAYPNCPECQYDFRGRPNVTQCPECGAAIDRGRYETMVEPTSPKPDTLETRKRKRRIWGRLLVLMFFGMIPVLMLTIVLSETAGEMGSVAFCVIWVAGMIICMIQFVNALDAPTDRDTVDRHTL